nr:MAG TPA: hypothetical protein [Caudoviricetes sp.]
MRSWRQGGRRSPPAPSWPICMLCATGSADVSTVANTTPRNRFRRSRLLQEL